MTKYWIFFAFSAYFGTYLSAQEYRLIGNIRQPDGSSMPYVNVLLLKSTDSTTVYGTSSDDLGAFEISNVKEGDYLLAISYMGNQSISRAIDVSSNMDLGTINFSEETNVLDEVEVTLKRPNLERKVDRLVFNVANTSLSDTDIWNVLKRTPGVVIAGNELSIKGSNNIGVMINDRMVNIPKEDLINLLSGTSASSVEAIEVITNPPAKYSAEGGMLINIKMNKNLVSGYNGAIYNRYSQGVFPKHSVGTDQYFKGKKSDFSIFYNFSQDKNITRYTDITTYIENGAPASTWTAEQDFIKRQKKHNLSAFYDIQVNDRNRISLSTINSFNPNVNRFFDTKTQIVDTQGSFMSSFITTNDSNEDVSNNSFYADWNHKLKKKGAEFSVNTHYTYYDSDKSQDLQTDFYSTEGTVTGENDFTTQSVQQINLFNLQFDFSSPFGESTFFESGLRYAGIDSKSKIFQEGFDRSQPGIDPTEAGIFDYDESIYAAYMSLDNQWGTWRLKSGLRGEYTRALGNLDISTESIKRNYLEIFPSISLDYKPGDKHNFQFYYYRRIERPRYNSINPFQVFQSNNSVIEGNPNLLPATRNYMALGYTFDQSYTFEVYYKNQKNDNQSQVFQDNESNLLRFLEQNLVRDISYGVDFYMNKQITNAWSSYLLLTYYHKEDQFTDLDTGSILKNGLWAYFMRANNSFEILSDKSLTADLDFIYASKSVNGNSISKSWNSLNFSLRKTLWKKKASISLGIEDMFKSQKYFNSRNFLNQNNSSLDRPENRLLTFGFRYKFGNQKIRNNEKSKSVDEIDRL